MWLLWSYAVFLLHLFIPFFHRHIFWDVLGRFSWDFADDVVSIEKVYLLLFSFTWPLKEAGDKMHDFGHFSPNYFYLTYIIQKQWKTNTIENCKIVSLSKGGTVHSYMHISTMKWIWGGISPFWEMLSILGAVLENFSKHSHLPGGGMNTLACYALPTRSSIICCILPVHCVSKKRHTLSFALTLTNIDVLSRFLQWYILWKICNNAITKYPTTPELRSYTTLWNTNFQKSL